LKDIGFRHSPLVGKTSAEKRASYFYLYAAPLARRIFESDPKIKGIFVGFAQYWDDEADDAVHDVFVLLSDPKLTWAEAFTEKNECGNRYEDTRFKEINLSLFGNELPHYWDNSDLIMAFGAYTKEGSSQNQDTVDAYTPFALLTPEVNTRYGASRIEVKAKRLLETPIRPRLENRLSEWQQESNREESDHELWFK